MQSPHPVLFLQTHLPPFNKNGNNQEEVSVVADAIPPLWMVGSPSESTPLLSRHGLLHEALHINAWLRRLCLRTMAQASGFTHLQNRVQLAEISLC